MSLKTIFIEVEGGLVTDVHGIPDGYQYEIVDHDTQDEDEEQELKEKLERMQACI